MADVATLHLGFIAYGPDSQSAYANGSRTSNAIADALKKSGAPEDALESENQNVSPVQPYQVEKLSDAEKAQRKFQVTQSWTLRSNAKDASRLLDIAVKAGANQSGQIDWSLADEKRPPGRSRRQGPPASPRSSRTNGRRHERQVRRPHLCQQRNSGRTTTSPNGNDEGQPRCNGRSPAFSPSHQPPPCRKIRHRVRRLRGRVAALDRLDSSLLCED